MAANKILLPDGVTELANIKSVTFKEAVNSGVDLRPGCVGSASIEVEVYNAQPNAVSAGDALTYYQIDKNNTQTLIGVFYAEPVIATKNSYKFIAYDAAQKLEADFSQWLQANQANFPMTIYALVSAACTVAGVTLGSALWPLSTENVQAFYVNGLTCRDILSYAAELACRFVRCDTSGNITFAWYATAANKRIYPSAGTSGAETRYAYKQDGLNYANYTTAALARVAVHPSGEDDVAYIYPTGVSSGNTLHIQNNLLLTGADASMYNAAAQNIYNELSALGVYRPATAVLFPRENPFRAGDVVAVTDAQGVSFNTVIMTQTVNDTDAILASTGNEDYADGGNDPQREITQLASNVVRINKLKVGWAEIDQAIVNYLTANNITAQNLTIVDENGNVLATYDANGITLGQTDEAHAELDLNSFALLDKNGVMYFSVGDDRDVNGEIEVTMNYVGDGSTTHFNLYPITSSSYYSTFVVTVNGAVVTNYTPSSSNINFSTAPADGDEIVITYKSNQALYHYDIGQRKSGTNIGQWSIAGGYNATADAAWSAVIGGQDNSATAGWTFVGGGQENQADAPRSAVVGGRQNKALGSASVVIGGGSNKANGEDSVAIGGGNNKANGRGSVAIGSGNTADGEYALAVGKGTKASGDYSFVSGKFNIEDNSNAYAEIIGNGTDGANTSNARTLDWSGNETLAGALAVGDVATTLANLGIDANLCSLHFATKNLLNRNSVTINVGNGARGILITSGGNVNTKTAFIVNTTTAGVLSSAAILSNASITLTGNNDGTITVSNATQYDAQVLCLYAKVTLD